MKMISKSSICEIRMHELNKERNEKKVEEKKQQKSKKTSSIPTKPVMNFREKKQ